MSAGWKGAAALSRWHDMARSSSTRGLLATCGFFPTGSHISEHALHASLYA